MIREAAHGARLNCWHRGLSGGVISASEARVGEVVMHSLVLERLETALGELARTVTELKAGAQHERSQQDKTSQEYLSVKQLALMIPYREQTIPI